MPHPLPHRMPRPANPGIAPRSPSFNLRVELHRARPQRVTSACRSKSSGLPEGAWKWRTSVHLSALPPGQGNARSSRNSSCGGRAFEDPTRAAGIPTPTRPGRDNSASVGSSTCGFCGVAVIRPPPISANGCHHPFDLVASRCSSPSRRSSIRFRTSDTSYPPMDPAFEQRRVDSRPADAACARRTPGENGSSSSTRENPRQASPMRRRPSRAPSCSRGPPRCRSPCGPSAARYIAAESAISCWLVQMLLVARSRRMCCSRVCSVST